MGKRTLPLARLVKYVVKLCETGPAAVINYYFLSSLMPNDWNKSRIIEGLRVIEECRPDLLCHLKELLENYNNTCRSIAYYDLIAGIWLEYFMHVGYVAWEQVQTLPPITDEEPILELSSTLMEFGHLIANSETYHRNLRLAIQRFLADEKPTAWLQQTEGTITNDWGRTRYSIKTLLKRAILQLVVCKRPEVLICAPYFKGRSSDWWLAMWKWRHWIRWDNLDEFITVPINYDREWRYNRSKEFTTPGDFSTALKSLLPLCIPAVFLEGYKDFRAQVLALKKPQPRIVYTANALHFNMTFKFLVAEWREQGTILLSQQHGGGYGIERSYFIEDFEIRVSDRFYSWGWLRGDRKVQPLPAGIYRAKRSKHSKQILLICVSLPKTVIRLVFQPMPGTIEKMIRQTVDFVSTFPEQGNLLIRPYFKDYGWGFLDKLKRAAPNAKYDTLNRRPSSFKRFEQSRLVVHSYIGTSWLETLALDIPTVCFYDPETYSFREEAQPFIDALATVGVLHHSGNSAALFVESLAGDIEKWWNKVEVQEARRNFVAQYANFSPYWKEQWEQEFKAVLVAA